MNVFKHKTPKKPSKKNENKDIGDKNPLVKSKVEYLCKMDSVEVLCDKNYFRFFEFLAYAFVITICVLGYVILSISTSRPDVRFFALNKSGEAIAVYSVGNDDDTISNASVQTFITNAIPQAFTFDFNNYNYVFSKKLPKYFSGDAASSIKEFFIKNYIPSVTKEKQFFNISIRDSYIINQSKTDGNQVNKWRVQVPAIISIYNGRTDKQSYVKFQLLVTYTATNKNAYGLQITNIKMTNDSRI